MILEAYRRHGRERLGEMIEAKDPRGNFCALGERRGRHRIVEAYNSRGLVVCYVG